MTPSIRWVRADSPQKRSAAAAGVAARRSAAQLSWSNSTAHAKRGRRMNRKDERYLPRLERRSERLALLNAGSGASEQTLQTPRFVVPQSRPRPHRVPRRVGVHGGPVGASTLKRLHPQPRIERASRTRPPTTQPKIHPTHEPCIHRWSGEKKMEPQYHGGADPEPTGTRVELREE